MFIAFSDQENELEFEPKITNTADPYDYQLVLKLLELVKLDKKYLFGLIHLYTVCSLSVRLYFCCKFSKSKYRHDRPKACISAPGGVYWMDTNSFYIYNGSVKEVPCSVLNYVFSDLNQEQAFKIHAFTIMDKSEVGWFYPSSSSSEVDRYVIYNYEEGVWTYGQLERTAWLDLV